MGHSHSLIKRISELLSASYPEKDGHIYLVEQRYGKSRPVVYPDIQVCLDGKVLCVVEIGYTRPEKITYYKKQNIPDVRWYDKNGNLHTSYDEKVIIKKIQREYTPTPGESFFYVHYFGYGFSCPSSESCPERVCYEYEDCGDLLIPVMQEDVDGVMYEELCSWASGTSIFFNDNRIVGVHYCDATDLVTLVPHRALVDYWDMDELHAEAKRRRYKLNGQNDPGIYNTLDRMFTKDCGAAEVSLDELIRIMSDHYEIDFNYDQIIDFDNDHLRFWRTH